MQRSRLNTETLLKVKADDMLLAKIAQVNGVRLTSVFRWIKDNDMPLTNPVSVALIREHLGIPESEEIIEIYNPEPSTSTIN